MKKEEILEHQRNYIAWIETLQELSEELATSPYAEGKWSPNEIVMHLAEWDRFTLEERLPQMKEGEKLERFPDFEGFNAKAAGRAQGLAFKETLRYAKQQRQAIIEQLQEIDEVEWDKVFFIGEHQLSIRNYFTDFIEHDNHHKMQISNI
ncbi:DinB family protein [Psychrobacillus sp. L4]|uniref:DinB family protein n=1 Tax=Psychrobacillus sp. L4 TaxID=3236892 RepID=UPI0036F2D086